MNKTTAPFEVNRRSVLGFSVVTAATAALAACTPTQPGAGNASVTRILPTDPLVAQTEANRVATGKTITKTLTTGPVSATIAGQKARTWGYNGSLVAPTLHGQVGDQLAVTVQNDLDESTTIHWHGLALRNNADGVPKVSQKAIGAGQDYDYTFKLPHPGTYWYHSHLEMQRERALYGALIIEDPQETLEYDKDWVIVLDDWLDGVSATPDEVLKEVSKGMGSMEGMGHDGGGPMKMGNLLMGAASDFLGGDAGDIAYPLHLFNGQDTKDPETFKAKPGERIRLRIINASADTAYRVGVPNQQLSVTHTDGFPVKHVKADAVVVGMGERIDAILVAKEGYTPLIALAEGKNQMTYGLLSTGIGDAPSADKLPRKLEGKVVDGGQLAADPSVNLPSKTVDRTHELRLTGGMEKFDWGINGHRFDLASPYENAFDIKRGERVEVKFVNDTQMWHPMHIHGHTFQVGDEGARKDTVIVRPGDTMSVYFDADNPGQWLTHCHNAYHAERGMMGVFSYIK